jgi:hypothetical protein
MMMPPADTRLLTHLADKHQVPVRRARTSKPASPAKRLVFRGMLGRLFSAYKTA